MPMGTKDRVKATIQDVEDKLQELMGEITGNPEYQATGQEYEATGQVKQDEAKAEHIVENTKDEAKKTIDLD